MKRLVGGLHGLKRTLSVTWMVWITSHGAVFAQEPLSPAAASALVGTVLVHQGAVRQTSPEGTQGPPAARELRPGDTISTGPRSRVVVRTEGYGIMVVGPNAEATFEPAAEGGFVLWLKRGLFGFFNRDRSRRMNVGRISSAAALNTEYQVFVDPNAPEKVMIRVFEGAVELTTPDGREVVPVGSQVTAEPGRLVLTSPGIEAVNSIQWRLYYPGVLFPADLGLSVADPGPLRESLDTYTQGDLLAALASLPQPEALTTPRERIYRAALLLSVGAVDEAVAELKPHATTSPEAAALLQVVAAVNFESFVREAPPASATAWLAESYYQQSRATRDPRALEAARGAARNAARLAPGFGFARARLAEMEFSFGRTAAAQEEVRAALDRSPRHAEALALEGFLHAAQNRVARAIPSFDRAIAADGTLGNAWLGRGLCRIRQGDREGGRRDLIVAAALEPQRSPFRSYLFKVLSDLGQDKQAAVELARARELDPRDPTSWLYGALDKDAHNRVNEAIADLEEAQRLGDNRAVFRSSMLLDQDRAVRSANLARLYHKADMIEVGYREAVRAVHADYASYSAHLFLADTFAYWRDPQLVDLRYETAAVSEYLVANLLAPVGAGILSPTISQGEYSRLFERNRIGVVSLTEYSSHGDWLQSGTVHGLEGNSSFAVEGFYRGLNGYRFNNDAELMRVSAQFKQQVTPRDTVLFQVAGTEFEAGDLSRSPDDDAASPRFRSWEHQFPQASVGYRHEWSPESQTLLFAQGLRHEAGFSEPDSRRPALARGLFEGYPVSFYLMGFSEEYEARLEGYAAEVQHLWEQGPWTLIGGGRAQWGEIVSKTVQSRPNAFEPYFPEFPTPTALQEVESSYLRAGAYAYAHYRILPSLRLIGGLTYDALHQPVNFRAAPLEGGHFETEGWNPKAGAIWEVTANTTLRAAYTRVFTGVAPDQSYQIEPAQVAGFTQSYRSAVPEYLVGASEGAEVESAGISFEHRFPTRTYVGLGGDWIRSELARSRGGYAFDFQQTPDLRNSVPIQIIEEIRYVDRGLGLTLNQLLGDGLSLGARYRVSWTDLEQAFPSEAYPLILASTAQDNPVEVALEQDGSLHQLNLGATYNHRSGWFVTVQGLWHGWESVDPDVGFDALWHLNAMTGYRLRRNRGEIAVGVLNATDEREFLVPLASYSSPPRERQLVARLAFSF